MASVSTPGPTSTIAGARMNTPGNDPPLKPAMASGASKDSRWRPYALRRTVTGRTPSGSWSSRPSSTFSASRIRPAQVAKTASPSSMRSRSGARMPEVSRSRDMVVDSPPGRNNASRPLRCSGARTSTASTPSTSSTSRCSRNAPWSASTPAFIGLAAAVSELHVEIVDLLAAHRRAEPARHLGHDGRVGVVRGGLHDGLRHGRRLGALEDSTADEHRLGSELHDQRGVGRGRDAAGAEHRHRELATSRDLTDQLDGGPVLLGQRVTFGVVGHGQATDVTPVSYTH